MREKRNNIVIITAGYPYVGYEQFLYSEFIELSKLYETVYLFPLLAPTDLLENLPENFQINNSLSIAYQSNNMSLIKNAGMMFQLFKTELTKNKNGIKLFKNLKEYLAEFKYGIQLERIFQNELEKLNIQGEVHYYSTWMNVGATVLCISKYKKRIPKFSFRVNGFDIFDERRKNNYMPFQAFIFKHTNKVIVLSKAGYTYLSNKNIYKHKLAINYSGVYKKGVNPNNLTETFNIVSCSNIIPLKRVEILAKALALINFKVNWTHFGDGVERKKIETIIETLPKNINAKLMGKVSNTEILDYYKTTAVDVFIHPSETEGLGMAIIEAQSFGIPAIGCDTGGVPEIIKASTGKLLKVDITPAYLAEEIEKFRSNSINGTPFKENCIEHFNQHFNITKNVQSLIDEIDTAN